MSHEARSPIPGEVWRIDPTWVREKDPFNRSKCYGLVIDHIEPENFDSNTYGDDFESRAGEVCSVLIEGHLYRLHWSWFRERVSF